MLLQDDRICVLFVTHWTLRKGSHGRFGPVNPHVGLQIAFGCEGSLAYLTLKWTLSRVDAVMHLKG